MAPIAQPTGRTRCCASGVRGRAQLARLGIDEGVSEAQPVGRGLRASRGWVSVPRNRELLALLAMY